MPSQVRKTHLSSFRFKEPSAVDFAFPEQPIGFNSSSGQEIVKLEIDWTQPKSKITADMQAWIDKFAETRQAAIPSPLTARKKPLKELKGLLKALSARRLLSRLSVKEAETLIATKLPNHKPLYNSDSAWSHARAKAELVLSRFVP